jgi:hypothetical protein
MTVLGGTERRPVGVQALRGIGFFVGGVATLMTAALLAWSVRGEDSDFGASAGRRAAGTAVIVVLLAGGYLTFRSLRRWAGRPRWLVPAASLLTIAALVPAVWAAAPATLDSGGCLPLIAAWQPVVAIPSAADVAGYESGFVNPATIDKHHKPAVDAKVIFTVKEARATPAFLRSARFAAWEASDAACAPVSRTHLAWSATAFGLGAAGIAAGVRRRRRA